MSVEWAKKFDIEKFSELNPQGFLGFEKIVNVGSACCNVPKEAGVYMVLLPDVTGQPTFCVPGRGAEANNVNPQSIETLQHRWVQGTRIIYIGKAGGPQYKTTLKPRLQAYMRYGNDIKASHRGGRSIWQLGNIDECLIAWRVAPEDPKGCESALLKRFKEIYGSLPFANRQG